MSLYWPKRHHQVKGEQGNKGPQVISLESMFFPLLHLLTTPVCTGTVSETSYNLLFS